jgi:hypothetical protein
LNTVDTVSLEDITMADSNNSEISGTENRNRIPEPNWIREIRSGLEALSGQNVGGSVPIKKLPAFLRNPWERYTPRYWQFGLHHRPDPQASRSESVVLIISFAAACKLNWDEWDEFCAAFVDNPADMLKIYGINSSVTENIRKEVQYQLTLDALTIVLELSSIRRGHYWAQQFHDSFNRSLQLPDSFIRSLQLPSLFISSLVAGGFNIDGLMQYRGLHYCTILDDLFLCENQIPMTLMKKAFSKCYGLLPEERRSNYFPELRELINPDSNVTKQLLDTILKYATVLACRSIFADPFPDKNSPLNIINVNYEVGKLENCAHFFDCIHKVMTGCVEVCATVETSIAVTTTGGIYSLEVLQPATGLKKAGVKIQGIPGMVNKVAFENGCLSLPIMLFSGRLHSHICNMSMYEVWNTAGPFPFANYLLLMSQLIKTPEDVSYLVVCDVIRPYHGTEQHIFQLWQSINIGLPLYSDEYREKIINPINRHCVSALNVMVTDFYNSYCSKPWLVMGVISALTLLSATLIQTYVLVIGSDKMQPHFPRGG